MDEPRSLDGLYAAARRDEAEARALERALARLDGSTDWTHVRGSSRHGSAYDHTNAEASARFRADLAADRLHYLLGRYEALGERAAAQQAAADAHARGINRFLNGSYSLDRLMQANRRDTEAFRELQRQRIARQQDDRAAEIKRTAKRRSSAA